MKLLLTKSKQLLSDDGVIFVSIDDKEQAYLKVLMDEIFGEENFIANTIWHARRGGGNDVRSVAIDHEYLLCYALNKNTNLLLGKEKIDNDFKLQDKYISTRGKYNLQQFDRGSLTYTLSLDYPIIAPDGTEIYAGHVSKDEWLKRRENKMSRNDWRWMMSEETFKKALNDDFIEFSYNKLKKVWNVRVKTYQFVNYKGDTNIERLVKIRSILSDDYGITRDGNNDMKMLNLQFSYPKPVKLIKGLISYFKNKNAIILDFFAGSGTTGHAVMELNQEDGGNRKFILCTNNQNNIAHDICAERLYRIINGYGSNGEENFSWLKKQEPFKNESVGIYKTEIIDLSFNSKNANFVSVQDLGSNAINVYSQFSNDIINENVFNALSTLPIIEEEIIGNEDE